MIVINLRNETNKTNKKIQRERQNGAGTVNYPSVLFNHTETSMLWRRGCHCGSTPRGFRCLFKLYPGKSSPLALASHMCVSFPIYANIQRYKQCTGNYINYNNLIRMMGIIMMRTMCFVKSNQFQTRITSCSLYMHLQHTVLLGLFPGNTLIRQSKRRGGKKSMLFGI